MYQIGPKNYSWGWHNFFSGNIKVYTLEGRKLMRKVAVTKASSQNFNGIDALASRARPT
jgi:hypothetical protein